MKTCPYCAEAIQDAAVLCRFCQRELPANTAPTAAQQQPPKKGSNNGLVILGLLAFLAVAVLIAKGFTPQLTPEQLAQHKARSEAAKCADTSTAFYMSQEFVKGRLRAPASAKFPRSSDPDVGVRYLGDCTHEVLGFVDSQNGFGALIRSKYIVKLKNDKGTDKWQALSVDVLK